MTTAAIVGGGIGGLSAAIALRNVGVDVQVFDQAPELTEIGAGLSLWANATKALSQLGLDPKLRDSAASLRSLESRDPTGRILHHADLGPLDRSFKYVSSAMRRGELLQLLLNEVPVHTVLTNSRLQRLVSDEDACSLELEDGRRIRADLVIGADGLFSTIRQQLEPHAVPEYAGYATWRGVGEIDVPGDWPTNALVRTVGRGEYFGIGEINPRRYLWYATRNRALTEPEPGGRKATLLRQFGRWHSPIPELIEATPEVDMLLHPVYKMVPLERWTHGSVALLGDAAHPVEPSLGMGAALAIEDGVVLGACFKRASAPEDALALYERTRRPRVNRMVRWSHVLARSEQMTNPALSAIRDFGTRLTPSSLTRFLALRAFDFTIP